MSRLSFTEKVRSIGNAMAARARRKDAVSEARWLLEVWADYGRAADLDEAIRVLREAAR